MKYSALFFLIILIYFSSFNIIPNERIEFLNRRIYSFNRGLDKIFSNPCTDFYIKFCPNFFTNKIDNFFTNLFDIQNLFFNFLYLDLNNLKKNFLIVFINSTYGIFGLFKVSDFFNLSYKKYSLFNDKFFKLSNNSYIFFPFLGPFLKNHIFNLLFFQIINPFMYFFNNLYFYLLLEFFNKRSHIYIDDNFFHSSFLDGYSFLKDVYFQHFYVFNSNK